ncbi:hypothetical protein D0T49_00250 [Paludibacter sp. 221]|uniref:hypothetical protein n=1 Tax=Paludibacter sp. 221 TaxID=2302939 RepID=UPI0013D5B03A|nr:hypothetical protein [Paludibacter sp. 221]NDV45483.1 hypothetical protein [Paludibacter sp. 221]
MKKNYKHDFYNRLQDLNKTIGFVLVDFLEKYDLKIGCMYEVKTVDGKSFYGFFRHLKVSVYHNGLDVWSCFYKVKKDGTPSKIDDGAHMSKIIEITKIH